MQRHVTSVFSEYDTMDNNSANSKQLQYWLKQISNPSTSPNFGYEWTFMSNQSSYQDRNSALNTIQKSNEQINSQVSFGGKTAHSSVDVEKQNNSFVSNKVPSKSYKNAMDALQKKVKTLEEENNFMRINLSKINEDKNKSMSQSFALQEELKNRIKLMEPKLSKADELIEENKVLRVSKEQKNRRLKLLQKNYQQIKSKHANLEQNYQKVKEQKQEYSKKNQNLKIALSQLQNQAKQLVMKNKKLQNMQRQSSMSILKKYQKSLDYAKQLQNQIGNLKNNLQYQIKSYKQKIKELKQASSEQRRKFQIQNQKLKENNKIQQKIIQQKKSQIKNLQQALQNKNKQYIQLIKSNKIQEEVTKQTMKIIAPQKQKNRQNIKQISLQTLKQKQQIPPSKESSVIQIPQTLVPGQKMSFNGFQSQSEQQCEQQFDESCIPSVPMPIETKSVGKPIKMKKNDRKKVLSSQSRNQSKSKKKQIVNTSRSQKQNIIPSQKQISKISKKKKTQDENSFIMKSCQAPRTQPMYKITFEGDTQNNCNNSHNNEGKIANSYFYTAQYPPMPYLNHRYHEKQQQVQDFNCNHNTSYSVDAALMTQLQKQLLLLYTEQQNLLLASKDQFATPNQRSQFFGRIHQISELLNVKNNKVCQLKRKIGS